MKRITTGDLMHVYGGFAQHVDYSVRLTVRMTEPVTEAVLARALARTQKRYPYFQLRLRQDECTCYYEENSLPVVLVHTDGRITLNTEDVNDYLWAVCWHEDYIHLDVFHGMTDGTGMYHLLSTLLYYYCEEKYGLTDHRGIRVLEDLPAADLGAADLNAADRTAADRSTADLNLADRNTTDWKAADRSSAVQNIADLIPPGETDDPQDHLPDIDLSQIGQIQWKEAFTPETDGHLTPSAPTLWDLAIPESAFLRFTSANDASPGTMVSLLLARAIDSMYPDAGKDIISAYVVNARPMLKAPQTCHNCLSMVLFDYEDRIRKMPLSRQCTVYRGKVFIQSDEDAVRQTMAVSASAIRKTAEAAPSLSAKKEQFGKMFAAGEGYVSFLVSYVGKWSHPALGDYIREFWTHPPNTFSLMAEIAAVNGTIFISIQQRFKEDIIREAFLKQLEEHQIPCKVLRVMESDVAHLI